MGFDHLFFQGYAAATTPARLRRAMYRGGGSVQPVVSEEDAFVTTLLERADLCANAYLIKPLLRRIPACLRFLGVATPHEAQERIARDPGLARAALDVALLGVSRFFRDAAVFEQLSARVLPSLSERPSRLRIWSAGCAGGQELYSVAMLLARRGHLHCELIGTDCRREAVEQARRGVFDARALEGVDATWAADFFERCGDKVRIPARLRDATRWKCADLCSSVEPGPWDLVLWRNVAIYLAQPVVRTVWQRITRELAPGAFVVCGKAEQPPAGLPLTRISP